MFLFIDYQEAEMQISLTKRDLWLIRRQCELQEATSPAEIEGFTLAYLEAKRLAHTPNHPWNAAAVEEFILRIAALIDPRNEKGYRTVPVRFASGATALPHRLIPRVMSRFCETFAEVLLRQTDISPKELYREFEEIHPLEDGNGRAGDLLWKMHSTVVWYRWPRELPPDVFGTGG